MKRTLSLLLIFTLLALTACQPTPATSSEEESVLPPPTPWEQLQTISDELNVIYDSIAPTLTADTSFTANKGTGSFSLSMSTGAEEGGMMATDSMNMSGTMTVGDDITKMEFGYDVGGVTIPVINWTYGGKSYIQYPDMYPDGVFRAEDLGDDALTPSVDLFGDDSSTGIGFSNDELTDLFLEFADPNKNMTVTEQDSNKIFSLVLEGENASKLWNKLDKSLDQMFGALSGEDGIVGELSTASEEKERAYDKAVLTVTTDGKTFQNYLLEGFYGESLVDSLLSNSSASKDSVNYSISRKEEGMTSLEMTMTATKESTVLKADIPGEANSVKADITFTKENDSVFAVGTVTISQDMGGFSFSIPMDINLTVTESGGTSTMDLTLEMNTMGTSMIIDMDISITAGEVDLTFPYKNAILTYDEEDFYNKMVEAYPELFNTSQTVKYSSEDDKLYMFVDEKGFTDVYADLSYAKDGNVYNIENLGAFTIEGSDDTYTVNGIRAQRIEMDDCFYLYIDVMEVAASLSFYEDGICTVNLWGYAKNNSLSIAGEGDPLTMAWEFSEDYTTVTLFGQTLYLELSGSTEM